MTIALSRLDLHAAERCCIHTIVNIALMNANDVVISFQIWQMKIDMLTTVIRMFSLYILKCVYGFFMLSRILEIRVGNNLPNNTKHNKEAYRLSVCICAICRSNISIDYDATKYMHGIKDRRKINYDSRYFSPNSTRDTVAVINLIYSQYCVEIYKDSEFRDENVGMLICFEHIWIFFP